MPVNNPFANVNEVVEYYNGMEQRVRQEFQRNFEQRALGISDYREVSRLERQMLHELEGRIALLVAERQRHLAYFTGEEVAAPTPVEYRITYADNNANSIDLDLLRQSVEQQQLRQQAERLRYEMQVPIFSSWVNNNVTINNLTEEVMPRQSNVQAIKEKVINAIKLTDLKRLIKCGFELETQKSNGLTQNSRPISEERYQQGIKQRTVRQQQDYDFLRRALGASVVRQYYDEDAGYIDYAKLYRGMSVEQYDALVRAAEETARRNTNRSNYRMEAHEMFKIPLVEAGYDGSVRGFEFRTEGANTYESFTKASKEVFKINHEIDEKCSFHIHLSVNGLEHNYGEQFQLLLMEGVLRQANKVPATVLQRWRVGFEDTDIGQYFRWKVSSDKYTAIHKHHEFNTWEFRCFGNVQSHKDAMKCLKIALRAMQYAYSKQAKREGTELLTASNANQVAEKVANLKTWDEIKTLFPILNQTNQPLTGAA